MGPRVVLTHVRKALGSARLLITQPKTAFTALIRLKNAQTAWCILRCALGCIMGVHCVVRPTFAYKVAGVVCSAMVPHLLHRNDS